MLLIVSMLLEGPMKDPMGMGWPKSAALEKAARLPRIAEGLRLHWGFGLALLAAVGVWVLQNPAQHWGLKSARWARMRRPRFAGVPVNRVLLKTALVGRVGGAGRDFGGGGVERQPDFGP